MFGAHVDAALPSALKRVGRRWKLHATDMLHLDLDRLAILQGAEPLVVGAAGDEVAGIQGHHGRGELDQLRHPVLHVVGVVVVAQLPVVPEPHDDVVRLGNLVGRRDARPDRREGVERLAEPAPRLPGPPAFAARRHVDEAGIAKERAAPILLRDLLRRALDDERQLGLVHEDPRLGHLRQHDRVARADHRLGVFEEHVERPRLALRVFPVIGDAAEDLARPRQWRPEPHRLDRHRRRLCRELFERRPQAVEPVDEALHRQLRRMPLRHRARDIDDPPLGQDTGDRLAAFVEQHQLHAILPDRSLMGCSKCRASTGRLGSAKHARVSQRTRGIPPRRVAPLISPQRHGGTEGSVARHLCASVSLW